MSCKLNNNKVDMESSTGGNYEKYNQKTKSRFYQDFVYRKVYRNNKRVSAGHTEHEIEECYNHLTSVGTMDGTRQPDFRRFESIYILKDILTNNSCQNCNNHYVWKKQEKYLKEKIFCPDTGYLIILIERKFVYKFVSAYVIEKDSKKKALIEEYARFKNP